ncbi:DgyrCDS2957 [Dimorphilus gyrociliatus]|uniref:DgyrCDS2957 n=1 Tax=Dimorphilus gyrociliatus TaxID=2664684 RepID=A0A7I8VGV4_9ANNE|nr:DgyrCDS2957 [Dimorphilus gyrociliatus]
MDDPSDPTTPIEPKRPFFARFSVAIIEAIKDGERLLFKIITKSLTTGEDFETVREYDDFEYLNHCINVKDENRCRIIPPLPARPIVDAKSAQMQSKKMLGRRLKCVIKDEYEKDCRSLEKYLSLLIDHPVFGADPILDRFLTLEKAPPCVAISRIKSKMVDAKKFNHTDIDDYFAYQRVWMTNYKEYISQALNDYSAYKNAEQRQ